MKNYILWIFFRAILIMFITMTIVFIVLRMGTICPAQFMLGNYASAESIETLRRSMGLDDPLIVQYFTFIRDLVFKGDLGSSYLSGQPVAYQLAQVIPYTVGLVVTGIFMGVIMGMPLGIVAAVKVNSVFDHFIRLISLVGISLPVFVSGIILISLLSLRWGLFPATGGGNIADPISYIRHLIIPSFSIGLLMLASVARLTRTSLLEVLNKDYITTARSKGLSERVVVLKHALRNALLPLITYLGIYVNILLGSAVLIEVIFARPGVGRVIVDAIKAGDFPVAQSSIMLYAGAVVIVNFVVDAFYSIIDPRIRYN